MNAIVSTIFNFHNKSLENLLSSRKLQKLEDNLLIRSEHAALSNEVAQECSDLTSSTSDCNSNRGKFKVLGCSGEVSAKGLETSNNHSVIHS